MISRISMRRCGGSLQTSPRNFPPIPACRMMRWRLKFQAVLPSGSTACFVNRIHLIMGRQPLAAWLTSAVEGTDNICGGLLVDFRALAAAHFRGCVRVTQQMRGCGRHFLRRISA